MAFIEIHRHESDAISVTFTERMSALTGVASFSGSFADLKRVLSWLMKRDSDEVGEPIVIPLFQPPAEETDDGEA